MKQLQLLDCTLRDGGYINDWEFGQDTLLNVFERLVSAKIDVIEIGFLDQRRSFDPNRSIMPDTSCVEKIWGAVNKGDAMVVGMIDYGTCDLEHLQPASESYLDGIRVIFKKGIMHEAIAYCKQVKELGYKVFTQAVSITSYSDEELSELVGLVNDLEPYAVSMVDTYGLLHQSNLMHVFHLLDAELKPTIAIGYHAHNNFQMGYANGIEFLSSEVTRTLLVDGSLHGMGKSAGNAPLELLAMYMNNNCGKNYDMNQVLEAIDASILPIFQKVHWGYNLFYYIAASNKCHPNYVSYLMEKKTLSLKAVNQILGQLEGEKQLLYDKKYIETLYLNYQKKTECNDEEALHKLQALWRGKELLLIGSGPHIITEANQIQHYLSEHPSLVIAINCLPDCVKPDYLFLTNSKRYGQMTVKLSSSEMKELPIVATSNVTKTNGQFDYTLDYSKWIDEETEIPDNSLIMLLRVIEHLGISQVALAGFDGYSKTAENYSDMNMEYSFIKEKAEYLNHYVQEYLAAHPQMEVHFVTDSLYNNIFH